VTGRFEHADEQIGAILSAIQMKQFQVRDDCEPIRGSIRLCSEWHPMKLV
jgi:hypothetical protein